MGPLLLAVLAALAWDLSAASSSECEDVGLDFPDCPPGQTPDIVDNERGCEVWKCLATDHLDYDDDDDDYADPACPDEPALPAAEDCPNGAWEEVLDESSACISGWSCVGPPPVQTLSTLSPTASPPKTKTQPTSLTKERIMEPDKRPIPLSVEASAQLSESAESNSSDEEEEEEEEIKKAEEPTLTMGSEWTLCSSAVAAKDSEGLLIACGFGAEEWSWGSRCPKGTVCHFAVDNDYMLCCPQRAEEAGPV